MAEIKPTAETFAKIKVVGIGGGGGSAVQRMVEKGIRGVEFVAVNTDVQALHYNKAGEKLHVGRSVTRGLGAGMNPDLGRQAAEESQNEIRDILKGSDMVFITAGLGGGTGTGGAPVVAEIARDLGALTVAIVTKPFGFEGGQRKSIAERGFAELADKVDTIITINNDKLLQLIDKKTSLLEAFAAADDVLRQGVQGIAEIITIPGVINVDFADVKAVMSNAGSALMGIGTASGENRAVEAAKAAINSTLLDMSIDGARGIVFTVTGGPNLSMSEVNEAAKIITASADQDAKIIFGAVIDEKLKDEMRVTVVATGFDGENRDIKNKQVRAYSPNPFIEQSAKEEKSAPAKSSWFSASVSKSKTEIPPDISRKAKVSPLRMAQEEIVPEDSDEGELGIPAFIRKKMM